MHMMCNAMTATGSLFGAITIDTMLCELGEIFFCTRFKGKHNTHKPLIHHAMSNTSPKTGGSPDHDNTRKKPKQRNTLQ